jgi:hypothetical protein
MMFAEDIASKDVDCLLIWNHEPRRFLYENLLKAHFTATPFATSTHTSFND